MTETTDDRNDGRARVSVIFCIGYSVLVSDFDIRISDLNASARLS